MRRPKNNATDTAKTVDPYFDSHIIPSAILWIIKVAGKITKTLPSVKRNRVNDDDKAQFIAELV
ncbi:hypothetical protein RINTU1_04190 [Candidatus Regiella insecticola]|uniref:Uncharacterized protein n=1 Tax=Candidatus Regiella insecticola TaxID=138073 RepID=A0A6L2ZLY6_9ENTR|nr:hypothetical protein RINTU1_04190 [Candidatus Regiella insecticola]